MLLLFSIAVVIGLIVAALQPPFFAPDEPWHWQTAWFRFENLGRPAGTVCNQALGLPKLFQVDQVKFRYVESLPQQVLKNSQAAAELCMPKAIAPIAYGGVWSYPGFFLARLFAHGESRSVEKAMRTFFDARFLQLAISLAILFRFVQLAQQSYVASGRWTFGTLSILTVAATPIFLQQASAVSADSMVNALAIGLAATLLFWRQLSSVDALMLLLVGVSAATTKPIVLPAIASVFTVKLADSGFVKIYMDQKKWPRIRFDRQAIVFNHLSILAVLLALAVIALVVGFNATGSLTKFPGGTIDPIAQSRHMADAPVASALAMFEATFKYFAFHEFLGNLGWLDTPIGDGLVRSYKSLFSIALLLDTVCALLPWHQRSLQSWAMGFRRMTEAIFLAVSAMLTISLAAFALYLTWTVVGAESVNGLQPRYFLFSYILVLASLGFLFREAFALKPEGLSQQAVVQVERATGLAMALKITFTLVTFYVLAQMASGITYAIAKRYW